MSTNIKDILKANVCAFCDTVYSYECLDEEEFYKSLDLFLIERNLDKNLIEYTYNVAYDIEEIDNICRDFNFNKDTFEYIEIINCSKIAFYNTLNIDKTINLEAFVDNLVKEFIKL